MSSTGATFMNAARSAPAGILSSSTMIVIRIAITPSLNASRRPLCMLDVLEPLPCSLVPHVAGVERRRGFEQQHVALLLGDRPVLDPAWHHDALPGREIDVPAPQLHAERALHDEEHLVLVLVRVPDERAPEADELDHLSVQLAGDARVPVVVDACKW